MSSLRHPDWHLLGDQRFRRRAAIETSHQMFRGEAFVVLSDRITGHHLRLSERAQDLWRLFDGRLTMNEIWDRLMRRPAIAPSQGELVDWVMQLVGAGLILSDHALDPVLLSERGHKRRAQSIEQRLASPLAIKIKLGDPRWLVRLSYPLVRPLFSRFGGVLVLATFLLALTLALLNWGEVTAAADQTLLSQSGLLMLALAYPVMKLLHELSHCYALHRFGGQVREFGVMLLLFFPVPYVEASDASALPDKRARMLVGAAGILSEMLISSIALILWLQVEPGVERAVLFNFVLIGSVSTLLFNGNPLLKFDAYFVLSDWLEMPNLAKRAGEYLQDLYLSRVAGLRPELNLRPGEAGILGTYGILSLGYRLLLTLTIAYMISGWFFVFGVLLAIWAIGMSLIWPLAKLFRKGHRMAKAQNRTRSGWIRQALFLGGISAALTLVPLPFSAKGQGRIVPLPGAEITAATSGVIGRDLLVDGATAVAGQEVTRLQNPAQTARRQALEINLTALEDELSRSGADVAQRLRLEREREVALTALQQARVQEAALSIPAPLDGRISWQGGQPPPAGSYVYRGDRLGYVIAPEALQISAAFPAAFSGRITAEAQLVMLLPNGQEIRRPVDRARVVDIGQQVPPELLVSTGGPVPEQADRPGMALDSRLILWAAPEGDLSNWAGARVEARVDLGQASAFSQLLFHVERLFLRVTRL
ncbi:peptidase M50 [Thalassovita sp.]|uniref:peptidase M50 n=1 Tax=Thalassovita sp. TaxID=1979401 RepID=UPI002AB20C66|nr:peptidase M50 [Thalassovita sp.]